MMQYPTLGASDLMIHSIYAPIFASYRTFVQFHHPNVRVLCRNSVLHGYAEFPYSDIDVSFFGKDLEELRAAFQLHQKLSFIFPCFAEINIYCDFDWARLQHLANPIEMIRAGMYGFSNIDLEADKFTFISRMIAANRSSLACSESKIARHKKLNSYLKLIGADDNLSANCQNGKFFERVNSVVPEEWVRPHMWAPFLQDSSEPVVAWADPVLYLKDLLHSRQPIKLPEFSSTHLRLFRSGVRWEICGLYTQILQSNRLQLLEHIDNLIELITPIKQDMKLESEGLETLANIISH